MPKIEHILFPLDFSEAGFLAAPFVRTIASAFHARASVLTVIPPAWHNPPGEMWTIAGLDAPEHEIQARQDRVLAQEFAGLTAFRVTNLGDPALKIMEFARRNHVDLIMMATHGVSGYRTMLLGSVTIKVLNDARCAVWTASHAEEQRSPAAPRTILCAVDDTPQALALMRWASEFSQRMGAELSLLHVVLPIGDEAGLSSAKEIQQDICAAVRAKLDAIQQSASIGGTLRVAIGGIAETVTEQ